MRRHINVTSRPAPHVSLSPARHITMDQRLRIWAPQIYYFVVALATALTLFMVWPGRNVEGRIASTLATGWVTELTSIAPCAGSWSAVINEDDICAVWLEGEDQHVVLGPLSAKP